MSDMQRTQPAAPDPDEEKNRTRLPGRRQQKIRKCEILLPGHTAAQKIYVAAGYLPYRAPEGSRVLEVFLHGAGQVGSERDTLLDKIAVLISLLLQFGCTPSGLRQHLAGFHLGAYGADTGGSIDLIGFVVDQLVEMQTEIVTELEAFHGSRE